MTKMPPAAIACAVLAAAGAHGSGSGLTGREVARLRWIEGTWRGTGDVDAPFYERYRFENDSTLVEHGLDSTLTVMQDTSRFELTNGRFGNARWRATVLAADSVVFAREGTAGQSFRWRRDGADAWTAVIVSPAGQHTYHMERWQR